MEVKVGCGNGIAKVTDSNMHALVAIHRLNTMYMCVCVCVCVCALAIVRKWCMCAKEGARSMRESRWMW